jgi:hypothetical protein
MRVSLKMTTYVEREAYHQPVYLKNTADATNEQFWHRSIPLHREKSIRKLNCCPTKQAHFIGCWWLIVSPGGESELFLA